MIELIIHEGQNQARHESKKQSTGTAQCHARPDSCSSTCSFQQFMDVTLHSGSQIESSELFHKAVEHRLCSFQSRAQYGFLEFKSDQNLRLLFRVGDQQFQFAATIFDGCQIALQECNISLQKCRRAHLRFIPAGTEFLTAFTDERLHECDFFPEFSNVRVTRPEVRFETSLFGHQLVRRNLPHRCSGQYRAFSRLWLIVSSASAETLLGESCVLSGTDSVCASDLARLGVSLVGNG